MDKHAIKERLLTMNSGYKVKIKRIVRSVDFRVILVFYTRKGTQMGKPYKEWRVLGISTDDRGGWDFITRASSS